MHAMTLVLMACNDPFAVIPGGELKGAAARAPLTWQFDQDTGPAQLETRPDDPYSINLVYVQLDGQLYIYAGNTRTNWVQHIEVNPLVRIRIEEKIYPMRAERVDPGDELNAFAATWSERSVFQRDPMQFDEVWLYRLHRRDNEAQ